MTRVGQSWPWWRWALTGLSTKAGELVGWPKFDAALVDPWTDSYLQTSVRLHAATLQTGNGAIPKLVFGSRWVVPQPYDADGLVSILHDKLGVTTN
jgi:hypothetical protein